MTSIALRLVVLRCDDMTRSALFYRALGCTLVEERHGTGPLHYSCTLGDVVIELYPRGTSPPSAGLRLGLRVGNVAQVVESVRAVGVGAVRRSGNSPPQALLDDPDGHRLELDEAVIQ